MPVTDISAGMKMSTEQDGGSKLLIGATGNIDPVDLRRATAEALKEFPVAGRVVVSYPDGDGAGTENGVGPVDSSYPDMIPYRPAAVGEAGPWAQVSAAQRGILSLAVELKADACVVMGADASLLRAGVMQALAAPVLAGQCDLSMPVYAMDRFEGLINTAILMPLARALFCRRVQMPLALNFASSKRFAERVAAKGNHGLLWQAIVAAGETMQVGQVHLPVRHQTPMEGLELAAVLAQIVGSLFVEMERSASVWQRGRTVQPTPVWGRPAPMREAAGMIETKPMIESFQLAARNLDELWQLVLPPVTLLELKHLARSPVERFRMPDRLWARIVYDFALAHRLRTISRTHLMGALAPLYLGWVASYAQEVSAMSAEMVTQRQEQLALVFEANKPYLVSRWRWPDRFNP